MDAAEIAGLNSSLDAYKYGRSNDRFELECTEQYERWAGDFTMSGTKMIVLWLFSSISIAALIFFISGWRLERKRRKTNPDLPRGMRACKDYVIGFFLWGCAYVVAVAGNDEILMRTMYAGLAILMFLNAVVWQKRIATKMPESPVSNGELPHSI
jgi:hypothetical protein